MVYKVVTIVHKFQNGCAPTCSACTVLPEVPRMQTATGNWLFSVAGPRVWNSLPATVCDTNSSSRFRKLLKVFLFIWRPQRRWRCTVTFKWTYELTNLARLKLKIALYVCRHLRTRCWAWWRGACLCLLLRPHSEVSTQSYSLRPGRCHFSHKVRSCCHQCLSSVASQFHCDVLGSIGSRAYWAVWAVACPLFVPNGLHFCMSYHFSASKLIFLPFHTELICTVKHVS